VRHLVELHGGTVHASPGIRQGQRSFKSSASWLSLARQALQSRFNRRSKKVLTSSLPSLDGLRVLVVDDEPDARELLRRWDSTEEVTAVATVAEAIEACNGCSQMYW